MPTKNKTLKEIRSELYGYDSKYYPYLNDWVRNPYTWFKSRFYKETSSVLIYFLMKTNIKPNTVTIVYGFAGIVGGILLAIPNNGAIITAIAIFFLKNILDWSDGHLARMTGQASLTGAILDPYGAHLGALGLKMGLGFYVAQKSNMMIFFYLIPLIPFCFTANLVNYSKIIIFGLSTGEIISYRNRISEKLLSIKEGKASKTDMSVLESIYYFIQKIFDDRARGVDLICLLVIIEIYSHIFVTWIVFLFLVFKQCLVFLASLYVVIKGR